MTVQFAPRSFENGGEGSPEGSCENVSNFDTERADGISSRKNLSGLIPDCNTVGPGVFAKDVRRITVSQLSVGPKMPWELGPMSGVFKSTRYLHEPNFNQSFVGMNDFAKGNPIRAEPSAPPAWVAKYAEKRRRINNAAVSSDDLRCRALIILNSEVDS